MKRHDWREQPPYRVPVAGTSPIRSYRCARCLDTVMAGEERAAADRSGCSG